MDSFQVYKDMKARTNGEIYIGVVGPVRTGKSTFIRRFAELLILPNLKEEHVKQRTQDELPQAASGTTIMTTEPKFVPKEAAAGRLCWVHGGWGEWPYREWAGAAGEDAMV